MSAFIQGRGDVFGPIGAVAGNIPQFDGTTGKIIKDGKTAPAGAIVGTTDTQTLSNKSLYVSSSSASYVPSGVIYSAANYYLTTGTAEQTAHSYVMPAGVLAKNGDVVRITVTGGDTGSVGNKTKRFKMNGVLVFSFAASASTIAKFHTVFHIYRQGDLATSARVGQATHFDDGTSRYALADLVISPTIDFNAPMTLSITGQAAVGQIYIHSMMIEALVAP